jgi:hypothetical protein
MAKTGLPPTAHPRPEGRKAVIVSVSKSDRGLRLKFDDGALQKDGATWGVTSVFTHHDFPATAFVEGAMSQEDFAAIGAAVVARLIALEDLEPER